MDYTIDKMDDFVNKSFAELKKKYSLVIEAVEGSLYTHFFNDYVHLYVNTEMFNRDKYALTVKVVRDNANYFFSIFTLYHYIKKNVPVDFNYKDGFHKNVFLLDKYYFWLLNGEYSELNKLILFGVKHDFLFSEKYDHDFYDRNNIPDRHEVRWVTEMEHWVRYKYNLMLDMYQQEANNGNVLAYFPLKDFDKIKPLLVEQLFINKWDNPTWDVYWGSTDYSWVKRLAEKAGF